MSKVTASKKWGSPYTLFFGKPILFLYLTLLLPTNLHAKTEMFDIEVSPPKFILPQFSGEFQERETSIAPKEYEIAERLRGLLDSGQKDAVLKELETFYDIELSPALQTLKAQIYFSLKMYSKAESTYLAVLKRMPQLVRAHSDLAQLYLLTDKLESARDHFAKAVAFGSNEAIIHGQLAYLNLVQFGPFSAISEYQQAMALEPDNTQWQQGLLAALYKAGMYDSARVLLNEILTRHPNESELWLSKATLELKQDNTLSSLAALEMAILLGNQSETNLRTAAQLHLQLHSYDRAYELLQTHLKNSAFNMATLNEYLTWMGQVKKWSLASKLLDNASAKLDSMTLTDQSIYYYHRGQVSFALEKRDESEKYYNKALDLNPSNGKALIGFANFNAKNGDKVKAELLYVRAEAISETEKEAILGLSQLYIDMQDFTSAVTQLKNAYNKFPDLYYLLDNIKIIENIIRTKK